MKRRLTTVLLISALLANPVLAFAENNTGISLEVLGEKVSFDDAVPFIDENNRTLIPLRAAGESLNLDVEWDGSQKQAKFSDGTLVVSFTVNSNEYKISDTFAEKISTMDTAAVIRNDRIYAPIRYIAEAFGYAVKWDAATKTIQVSRSADVTIPTLSPTMGEQNALKKAHNYLSIMAFSYSKLIKQLEFEGFTNAEATYAADNCGADWNEQAAKKAEAYLEIMAFSKEKLIDQLKFEEFTEEQAVFGVEAAGY